MAAPSEWFVVEVFSPRALRLDPGNRDPLLVYSAMLARLRDLASQFDVVHSHLDWLHIPLLSQLIVPFVTTLHGPDRFTKPRQLL
jgi:hypothetical protein